WLDVADNYESINVEKELQDGQIFRFYQALIRLRKTYPIIAEGNYQRYEEDHPQVYAFMRTWRQEKLLVLNNFYGESTDISVPKEFQQAQVLIGHYPERAVGEVVTLAPYETLALYLA